MELDCWKQQRYGVGWHSLHIDSLYFPIAMDGKKKSKFVIYIKPRKHITIRLTPFLNTHLSQSLLDLCTSKRCKCIAWGIVWPTTYSRGGKNGKKKKKKNLVNNKQLFFSSSHHLPSSSGFSMQMDYITAVMYKISAQKIAAEVRSAESSRWVDLTNTLPLVVLRTMFSNLSFLVLCCFSGLSKAFHLPTSSSTRANCLVTMRQITGQCAISVYTYLWGRFS